MVAVGGEVSARSPGWRPDRLATPLPSRMPSVSDTEIEAVAGCVARTMPGATCTHVVKTQAQQMSLIPRCPTCLETLSVC